MSGLEITSGVFLWIGVAIAAISSITLVFSTELFDRLHYMAPVANVAAVAIFVAVLLQEGWGQGSMKMLLICAVLIIMNAVLAHATARAARVREFGTWTPQTDEQIRGAGASDDVSRKKQERR